jgi:serine/threonine-protein kinase|nr:serine/threonine-protein kinase [Kofleriaceae bacterium]
MGSASIAPGLAPGQQVGKYLLGRKLGQGGFGVVFLAQDTSLDREVALKFLNAEHTSTPEIIGRFLQEARSAAKIAHPGIVTVFECAQVNDPASAANGAAYIAMERLDGESLTERLARSGKLAPQSAMEIGRQVAAALDAAHRAGIVHRDLKPDNIYLVPDPAVVTGERVKVLDFGIAKLGRTASSSVQTQSMMVFGTPRYMSPEQCKSAAHVDARSDIYTLGCILFELVCGVAPFDGTPGELIGRHVFVEAPSVQGLVPDAPPHLVALIARMLAKEPDARPQTMAEVQRALESGGAMAPGLAPTLAPGEMAAVVRAATAGGSGGVRSLGVRPGSSADVSRSDGFAGAASSGGGRARPANPTTLASASGSSVVSLKGRRGKGVPIAAMIAAVVVVGGIAWWLGFHAKRSDEVDAPAAAAAAPLELPKQAAAAPVEAPNTVPPPVDKPATVTIATGTVTITSQPAMAISIDSGAPQQTPVTVTLPVGHHSVQFVNKPLHVDEAVPFEIAANQTEKVARDFRAHASQPPKTTPPQQPPKTTPPKTTPPKTTPPPQTTTPPQQNRDGTINPFAK